MTVYVALLRAVNMGCTGKLPMAELVGMCQRAGFRDVRTYIASGNAVFSSSLDEAGVRDSLAHCLHAGDGMAGSRLRIPFAAQGTGRNINTVARLAAMAAELD